MVWHTFQYHVQETGNPYACGLERLPARRRRSFSGPGQEPGCSAVNVIPPTAYENLDKGIIDGSVMSCNMVTDWNLQTLINYYYMIDMDSARSCS